MLNPGLFRNWTKKDKTIENFGHAKQKFDRAKFKVSLTVWTATAWNIIVALHRGQNLGDIKLKIKFGHFDFGYIWPKMKWANVTKLKNNKKLENYAFFAI